jgi:mitochondrial chaperone BCS1
VSDIRPISIVILNKSRKSELLKDIGDFLNPVAQKKYFNRGFPYRRDYLLYGFSGTSKSSLSKSLAGYFGLDVYILNFSDISEKRLRILFAKLPSRCVILLEDINAVSSNRSGDTKTEHSRQMTTSSPSQKSKYIGGKILLSALLNVIDGVALQEGRILIMTTNYIARLDKAFIRPSRADKKVELGLADKKMTADFFCLVFKPKEGEVTFPKDAQSEAERVKRLSKEFAAEVPELEFSPAEILSFLFRQSLEEAIANVSKLIEAKSKPPRISEV